MENHHYSWENSLFLWPCSSSLRNKLSIIPQWIKRSSWNSSSIGRFETSKAWKKHLKNMDESKNWGNTKGFLWFSACQIKVDQFWATHFFLWNSHGSSSKSYPSFGSLQSLQLWRSQSPQFGKGPFQISSCFCSIIISHTKCNRLDI